jgi:diadenylate cyclase
MSLIAVPLFLHFGITDAVDIFLVAIILYLIYNLVKGTSAINVFIGLALIYVVYILVRAFDLKLLGSVLSKFVNVGVIAIIVLFQQEIRKFLLYIGSNELLKGKNWKQFIRLNFGGNTQYTSETDIKEIATACANMGASKTGALIVISRKSDLKFYIQSGSRIDSIITSAMLENIFYKNSPLHDGAVIIQDNRIVAARCVLPVTENENFPQHYGMRHRAAVGISEVSDAIAISVSEQTGSVSVTVNGTIEANLNKNKLEYLLEKHLQAF